MNDYSSPIDDDDDDDDDENNNDVDEIALIWLRRVGENDCYCLLT